MTPVRTIGAIALAAAATLSLSPDADAQRFQALYGVANSVEEAFDIEAPFDRGVYMSNGFTSFDNADFFAVQKDPVGNVVWANRYGAFDLDGNAASDRGYSLFPDNFTGQGYVLAGWTDARPPANQRWDNMIVGINEDGSLRFSRQYIGTSNTDTVHENYLLSTASPGVSIIQSRESGELYMTGNNANSGLPRPMLLRTAINGAFLAAADYGLPQFDARFGFTDIVELPPGVIGNNAPVYAVSGSVLRSSGERDVLLFIVDQNLNPLFLQFYDAQTTQPGAVANASATGQGIDWDPATGFVIIAGNADLGITGDAFPPFQAPHVLVLDPAAGFAPVSWTVFSPLPPQPVEPGQDLPFWESDYASVRLLPNFDNPRVVVGGTFYPLNGPRSSAAFVTDLFGGLLWSRHYAPASIGRSAVPAFECGVAVGGAFAGVPGVFPPNPFAPRAEHLVKTNDFGDADCLDPEVRLEPRPIEFEVFSADAVANFLDGDNELITDPIATGEGDLICFNPDCEDPQPCPGDANGDGIVDGADLLLVINNFGGPGPAGDVNNDGIVDGGDLLLVINNFGLICP